MINVPEEHIIHYKRKRPRNESTSTNDFHHG